MGDAEVRVFDFGALEFRGHTGEYCSALEEAQRTIRDRQRLGNVLLNEEHGATGLDDAGNHAVDARNNSRREPERELVKQWTTKGGEEREKSITSRRSPVIGMPATMAS